MHVATIEITAAGALTSSKYEAIAYDTPISTNVLYRGKISPIHADLIELTQSSARNAGLVFIEEINAIEWEVTQDDL